MIPRDEYGNVRSQHKYDLSDHITVLINSTTSSAATVTFGGPNDDGCADSPSCAQYTEMFYRGAGPCSNWSPEQLATALGEMNPPIAKDMTLDDLIDLCPLSCQSIGCSGDRVDWDNEADMYRAQYSVTVTSDYTIAVNIGDIEHRNSQKALVPTPIPCASSNISSCSGAAFRVKIVPGRSNGTVSTLTPLFAMNASAIANDTLAWQIELKDKFSNPRRLNDSVFVQVECREWVHPLLCNGTGCIPWTISAPQIIPCLSNTNISTVVEASSKGYQVQLHTTTSSPHPYMIAISSLSPCSNCDELLLHVPFSVVVEPGPPDPMRHTINGCLLFDDHCWRKREPTLTMPNYVNRISVQIRDMYDNHRSGEVAAAVSGPSRGVSASFVTVVNRLAMAPFVDKPTDVFVEFTSVEEWNYSVHISIDGGNSTTLDYRYGVHSSLNVSACPDCRSYFETDANVEIEYNQNKIDDCAMQGCMFTAAHDQNGFFLTIETGFWDAHNSTNVLNAWDAATD
eukprot:COSAG02_NODE_5602_length_4195_cov_3.045898_1_plen_510_part_10